MKRPHKKPAKRRPWTSKVEVDAELAGMGPAPQTWGELPDWLVGAD